MNMIYINTITFFWFLLALGVIWVLFVDAFMLDTLICKGYKQWRKDWKKYR